MTERELAPGEEHNTSTMRCRVVHLEPMGLSLPSVTPAQFTTNKRKRRVRTLAAHGNGEVGRVSLTWDRKMLSTGANVPGSSNTESQRGDPVLLWVPGCRCPHFRVLPPGYRWHRGLSLHAGLPVPQRRPCSLSAAERFVPLQLPWGSPPVPGRKDRERQL